MEKRPDRLVWISLVKGFRVPRFQFCREAAVTITHCRQERVSPGGIDGTVIARPANPASTSAFQHCFHGSWEPAGVGFRRPVITVANEGDRQTITHYDQLALCARDFQRQIANELGVDWGCHPGKF